MAKLWGSRFKSQTSKLADKFTFSISYDQRLAKYDVIGSMAHAKMLGKCGLIPKKDSEAIVRGLSKILKQVLDGTFRFDPKEEDVHSNIQTALKTLIGAPADKLHTARSRNDQVVLDVKLYCRQEAFDIVAGIKEFQRSILNFGSAHADVIIPAYTHLQAAQVVLLAHHMLAYLEMLKRDQERLLDCAERLDSMPLGSCALSGTSLETDRAFIAQTLGFSKPTANSMDSVSDRDFIMEFISVLSIMAMHLSRISEDLIIWASKEFDYIDIDWSFCTGSSIMPHKKNPDVLELMRGTTAQFPAAFVEIATLLKALPLTYNRDMQLDKPILFRSVETAKDMLEVMTGLFANLKIKKASLEARLEGDESFYSVDVMEYLIKKGMPYRQAHDTVGQMVKECLDQGIRLSDLPLAELNRFSDRFDSDVKTLFNPQMSVKIKRSLGSTNPKMVEQQLKIWQKNLRS